MRYLRDNLQSEFNHVKGLVTDSLTHIEEKMQLPLVLNMLISRLKEPQIYTRLTEIVICFHFSYPSIIFEYMAFQNNGRKHWKFKKKSLKGKH